MGFVGSGMYSRNAHIFSRSSRNRCEKKAFEPTKTDNLSGLSFFFFFTTAFQTVFQHAANQPFVRHIYITYKNSRKICIFALSFAVTSGWQHGYKNLIYNKYDSQAYFRKNEKTGLIAALRRVVGRVFQHN